MPRDIAVITADHAAGEARSLLGEALQARCEDVAAGVGGAFRSPSPDVRAGLFEAAGTATVAVAASISGGRLDVVRSHTTTATRAVKQLGRLAARHDVSLSTITAAVLRWRDTTAAVLQQEAVEHSVADDVLAWALDMVDRSADLALLRVAHVVEVERRGMHSELVERRDRLAYHATHDPLTGLANRAAVLDRVESALARNRNVGTAVIVVFIDLDHFKHVNDTYGHHLGDRLLCSVVERLRHVVRASDTLGRIGGDEFIVVAEGASEATAVAALAGRLRKAFETPFDLDDGIALQLHISASMGIAAGHGCSAEELLHDADIAMYSAKSAGRDCWVMFEPDMAVRAQHRRTLEHDLRVAIREHQFFVEYQPIVELTTAEVVAVEALARWRHPDQGLIGPDEFVPVLESTGLISAMGTQLFEQACRDAADWHSRDHRIKLSVNVSGVQLDSAAFISSLSDILAGTGLDPGGVVVEVTETTLVQNPERRADQLRQLEKLGVGIAVDDFGTGYSSLDQLRQLPIDTVKIDRSFVDRMLSDPEGEHLMATLINLAQRLGIETLAEGIETPSQAACLMALNCDFGQGFLFARPLPASEIIDYMRRTR